MKKKNPSQQFTSKHTKALRAELLALLSRSNLYLQPERRVSPTLAIEVANRDLRKTRNSAPDARVFSAVKAVSSFISLAAKNKVTTSSLYNSDLLSVGHPMSTKKHAMTASALRNARAQWLAADELIDDSARELVLNAHSAEPGSAERTHAFARLMALGPKVVPITAAVDPYTIPNQKNRLAVLVATLGLGIGGNSKAARSARANLQRRDRKGRFAEMGGGFMFNIRFPNGSFGKASGRVVGAVGDEDGIELEIKNHSQLADGIYEFPSSKGDAVKAILSESALKDLPDTDVAGSQRRAIDSAGLTRKDAPTGWTKQPSAPGAPEVWTTEDGYFAKKDGDVLSLHRANLEDNSLGEEVARGSSWADVQKAALADQDDYEKVLEAADVADQATAPSATTTPGQKILPKNPVDGFTKQVRSVAGPDVEPRYSMRDDSGNEITVGPDDVYDAKKDGFYVVSQYTPKGEMRTVKKYAPSTGVTNDLSSSATGSTSTLIKRDVFQTAAKRGDNVRFMYNGKEVILQPAEVYTNPKNNKINVNGWSVNDGAERTYSFDKIAVPTPTVRDNVDDMYYRLPLPGEPVPTGPFVEYGPAMRPLPGQPKPTGPFAEEVIDLPERSPRTDRSVEYENKRRRAEQEEFGRYVSETLGLDPDSPTRPLRAQIEDAIENEQNVRFDYSGKPREVTPKRVWTNPKNGNENMTGLESDGTEKNFTLDKIEAPKADLDKELEEPFTERVDTPESAMRDLLSGKISDTEFNQKIRALEEAGEISSIDADAINAVADDFIDNDLDKDEAFSRVKQILEPAGPGEPPTGGPTAPTGAPSGPDTDQQRLNLVKRIIARDRGRMTPENIDDTFDQIMTSLDEFADDPDLRYQSVGREVQRLQQEILSAEGLPASKARQFKEKFDKFFDDLNKRAEDRFGGAGASTADSDENLGKDDIEDLFDYLRRWDVIDGDIRRAVKSELSDVLEERQVSIDDVRNAIDGLYDSNDFDSGDLDKAFDEIAKEIRSQYDTSQPEILVGTREVSDGSATVKVTNDYEKPGDYYVELFNEDGELNDGKYFDPNGDSTMRQFANDLRDQFGPEIHDLVFREKETGATTRDNVRWDADRNVYTDAAGRELDADTVESLGLDPTGRDAAEEGIKPLSKSGGMPDYLENEFDSLFEVPEGAYKPDVFGLYVPKGRQEENTASYSDDPTVIANTFDRGELIAALEEAVAPVGSFEATGFGSLNFGEGEELVPAEAIYEALELQGGYGMQSLAGIYDIALGKDTTPNMDMYQQLQDDFGKLDAADLQPKLKKEPLNDEEARQLNKQISLPQNAQVILDEMNDYVETNEFIQSIADDLVNLSGEDDTYDPDALLDALDKYLPFASSVNDDQRQAFKGLWGMLISIDGGSSDPYDKESMFRKPLREALKRQYGDSWEEEYKKFLDEFGGFPEFASQKMRIVEGQDDLDSDTVAANFFRLMKAASTPNSVQLQRSFGINSANENLLGRYTTVGNIVAIDPRPFSTRNYAGERMLQSWIPRSNDDHRVVLVAEPGELDSISAVGISWFDGEQEHIGHGDLEVVNVERRPSPLPFRVDDIIVTVRRAQTSVEDIAAAETESAAGIPSRNIKDVSDWTFVAKKKGGSNPGAFYRDPKTGQDYYVKEPLSRSHAENETLASVFYDAFGAPSAEVSVGSDNGTVRVVSKLIPGATDDLQDRVNSEDETYLEQLKEHFIVDAWLANWDVAGLTFDNVMTDENGRPVRVDPGGALMWRAQGAPKSDLGQFISDTDDVPEIDTLRNPSRNATSAAVFGSLTDDDLREQAKMLLDMPPSRIDAIVDSVVTDPDEAAFIKERLKNRRQGILDRFGITPEDADVLGEPMPLGESIGFAAQDLLPGDVASGDSFTIERIFRDENTPKGKVSVEGYFPGHETQRKEWNEGTIIDAKRGGPTPPKGDNPALHRPKKPYAPTAPAFMGGIADELEAAQSWADVKDILKDKDLIFFDYETTGIGGGSNNRPVQLGAVRVRNGEVVDRFNMFMDPQEPLSDWSRENLVDGDGNPLTDDFLQQQTGLAEAHSQFVDWMGENPIIGAHNLPFDREVLERITGEENITFSPDGYIDTLRLARDTVKKKTKKNPEGTEGHRLGQLLDHYGIEIENWHSADADAASAANLFDNLLGDAAGRIEDPATLDFKRQQSDYDEALASHNEKVEQYKNEVASYEMAKAVAAAWNCNGPITAAVGDDEDGLCDIPSVDELIERSTVNPGELSDPDSLTSGDPKKLDDPYDRGEDTVGGVDKYPVEGEPYPPTAQQQDIINTVMDNEDSDVVVRAAAGAGKTSTLLALARRIQKYAPDKRIIYIAFNRSVADEARSKMPGNVEVRTADSISYNWVKTNMPELMKKSSAPDRLSKPSDIAKHLGLAKWKDVAAVRAAVYQFTISSDRELGPQHFEEGIEPGWLEAAQRWWADVQSPDGKMPFTFNHMKKLWSLSDPDLSDVSSGLKEGADVIFVDEFQDTNDVLGTVVGNQPNTQNVYVGDENQAIYQFMGAKDWLKKVAADFSLPLTQSFRFGPTIARQGNRFLRFKERYLGSPKTFSVEGAGKTPGTLVPRGSMTDADAVLVRTNAGAFKEIRNELLAGRTVGVTKGFKKDLDDFIAAVEWLQGDQSSRGYRPNRMPEDLRQFDNWSQVVDEASKDDSELSTKLKILTGDVEEIGLEGLQDLASQLKVVKGAGDKKDIETVPDIPQSDLAPGAEGDIGKDVTFAIDEAGVLLNGKTFDVKEDLKKAGAKWDKDRGGWFVKSDVDDDSLRKTLEKIQSAIFKDSEKQGGAVDVVVTTIHQAKGLEWPRVRMGNDFWGPRKDKADEWIFPEEPEIHLAYVGVTRAENELDMGGLSWINDWVADNDPEVNPGYEAPKAADVVEETDAPEVAPEVETPSTSEVPDEVVEVAEVPKIMYSAQGEAPSDAQKQSDIVETLAELDTVIEELLDPESGILKKPSTRKEVKASAEDFNKVRSAYENGEITAAEAVERLNDVIDGVPGGKDSESDFLETLRDYMIDYRRILDGTFYQRPQGKNLPPIDSSRGYSKDGVFITPGVRVRDKWGYAGVVDRYNKSGWVNVYVVRDIGNPSTPGKKYYQSKGTQHLTTIPEGGDDRAWAYVPGMNLDKLPANWRELSTPGEIEAIEQAMAAADGKGAKKKAGSIKPVAPEAPKESSVKSVSDIASMISGSSGGDTDVAKELVRQYADKYDLSDSEVSQLKNLLGIPDDNDDGPGGPGGSGGTPESPGGGDSPKVEAPSGAPEAPEESSVVNSVDEADVNAADIDPEWQTMLPTEEFTEDDFIALYQSAGFNYVDRHTEPGEYDKYVGLADYVGSTYFEVNNVLRGKAKIKTGDPTEQFTDASLTEEEYQFAIVSAAIIDDDFDNAPPLARTMILYRGLHSEYSDELMDSYEVGDLFTDDAYSSTTTDRTLAKEWAGDESYSPRLLLEIVAPEGTQAINMNAYLGGYSQHSHEDEVLLDRGTTFRVISKTTDPDGETRVMRVAIVSQQRQPIKDIREPEQDAPPPMGDEDEFVDPRFRDVHTFLTILGKPQATLSSVEERDALRTDSFIELYDLVSAKALNGGILVANIDGVRRQLKVDGLAFNAETGEWDLLVDTGTKKEPEITNVPVRKLQPVERTETVSEFPWLADDDELIDLDDMRGYFYTASNLVEEGDYEAAGYLMGNVFVGLEERAESNAFDADKAYSIMQYDFSPSLGDPAIITDLDYNYIVPHINKKIRDEFRKGYNLAIEENSKQLKKKSQGEEIEVGEEEDPDAITPAGRPKVVPKEKKPISESLVAGVKPLTEAIRSLVAREDGNKRIFESALVNGSDVEDHEIRVNIVADKYNGERKIRLRFKLTAWAGQKQATKAEDKNIPGAENIRIATVEIPKSLLLDNGDILVDDMAYGSYRTQGGRGYKYDVPTSTGTALVTFHRATKNADHIHTPVVDANDASGGPSVALHNMVLIELPIDATEEDISKALARSGITDLRATTEDDIKILAENRLLSVFGRQTDPSSNITDQVPRDVKLGQIQEKYGITATDVTVETDESGFITYKIPREVAERIAKETKAHTLEHSTSAASIARGYRDIDGMSREEADKKSYQTLFRMLIGNQHGESGIKSTVQRFFEGFPIEGQSSRVDLATGGADYVFLSSRGESYYMQRYSNLFGEFGNATFLFDPVEAFQRLEFYANSVDRYGRRDANVDVIDEAKEGAYEVMFKHGLSASALRSVLTTFQGRKKLLEVAKEEGVTEINGVPVERFITYYNTTSLFGVEDDLAYATQHMHEYFATSDASSMKRANDFYFSEIAEMINSVSDGEELYNPFDALDFEPGVDGLFDEVSIVGYNDEGDAIMIDARGGGFKVYLAGFKPSSPNYKKTKEINDPKEVRNLMDQLEDNRSSIGVMLSENPGDSLGYAERFELGNGVVSTIFTQRFSVAQRALTALEALFREAKESGNESQMKRVAEQMLGLMVSMMMTPFQNDERASMDSLRTRLNELIASNPAIREALAEWMRK